MNETVNKLINRTYHDQRSDEWLAMRGQMLTASDVAAVLGVYPYESREDVMYKKLGFRRHQSTDNTSHGIKYEPEARDVYCAKTGEVVHEIGLVPHPEYPWLGGSPDGITESGKLIEIKCPPKRDIKSSPPKYYMPQIQLLMEILDLEECDFIEYKPPDHGDKYSLNTIKRDREWFKNSLPVFQKFWDELQVRKHLPLCEIQDN